MFPCFNLKLVLFVFAYSVLAMDANPRKYQGIYLPKEKVLEVVKELQDIFLKFDCYDFSGGKKEFKFDRDFFINEKTTTQRTSLFYNQPIKIVDLKADEVVKILNTITELIRSKRRRENIDGTYHFNFDNTKESFLIKNMNTTVIHIGKLVESIVILKKQDNGESKKFQIHLTKAICAELYNNLVNLRNASFMDCIFPAGECIDFSTKIELSNKIYSMAFYAISEFQKILDSLKRQ